MPYACGGLSGTLYPYFKVWVYYATPFFPDIPFFFLHLKHLNYNYNYI